MADRGLCSRREAEEWMTRGWVQVNGKIIDRMGAKFDPENCKITVDTAANKEPKKTILLNKPLGYACSPTRENHPLAKSLLGKHAETPKLEIAGRLDINSRGLALFTTDGRVVRQVIGEGNLMEKEYIVRFKGNLTPHKLKKLEFGLELDDRPLKRAIVKNPNPDTLIFILHEGRKRQIRRMCELVDLEVTYLKRVRIGPFQLAGLKEGEYRVVDTSILLGPKRAEKKAETNKGRKRYVRPKRLTNERSRPQTP